MIHIYQGFCPDELQPDSRDRNCPACQVEAERNNLRAEVARLTAELAAFTPGGSEFHNSPDNCIQWIRERLESRARAAKERNQLRKKLVAAEKIFNHFGGLFELSKWENAGGETAANVVQEYLEL